ncbi:MAG: adenylate kinase [Halothermotrichaceae bacterium]
MNLTLLGLPGAGKGTQAKKISKKYNLPHIATGDIFRRLIDQGTPLGKKAQQYIAAGNLVPDKDTIKLVKNVLQKTDIESGFVLDGFPRTLNQARALTTILKNMNKKLDLVIYIDVAPEELVKRVSGRRVCLKCGATYHLKYNPPEKEGICDNCESELVQRQDDKEDTVRKRIKKHSYQINKLKKYYIEKELLAAVDGEGIDETFSLIQNTIEVELK